MKRCVSVRLFPRLLIGSVVSMLVAAALVLAPSTAAQAAPAARTAPAASPWPGHPGRTLVHYRVRPGDTATGIATRLHAWTAELLRVNHRSAHSLWRVGEHVVVPVVTARAHRATRSRQTQHHASAHRSSEHPRKSQVRDEVVRVANAHGMFPRLALAIAWQESGWQQDVRSSAGAVGTMQVMPSNRAYLSRVAGRNLHLSRLHDNVTAGVTLFRILRSDHNVHRSVAGYYQGIGSLRANGRYPSTKSYVDNVMFHWARLRHGWDPLS